MAAGASGFGIDPRQMGMAGGLSGIGGGLAELFFGGSSAGDEANKYLSQIPGQISPYYNPFIQAGNRALPILEGQYGSLLGDPGGFLNKIGANYQQSPGFKFALQQALQGAGNAAAAGGMAGSPMHQQQSMGLATNLANQDYNSWISKALGLYGQGLSGEQGLYSTGFDASHAMADQIAQAQAAQAQAAYAQQRTNEQSRAGGWGSLLGGAGTLAAFAGML